MNRIDPKTRKPTPLMVIIASDSNLLAAGDPATMSFDMANDITTSFKYLPSNERPKAIQRLVDDYRNGRRGYANVIDVVPYVGPNKTRADQAVREFLGKDAAAALKEVN